MFKKKLVVEDIKQEKPAEKLLISPNLDKNVKYIKAVFDRCSDLVVREFKIPAREPIDAALFYIDGMVDKNLTAANILRSLQFNPSFINDKNINKSNAFNIVKDQLLKHRRSDNSRGYGYSSPKGLVRPGRPLN